MFSGILCSVAFYVQWHFMFSSILCSVAFYVQWYFMFSGIFSEIRAVYYRVWKNMVRPDRPQMTIRRMRFPCWILKATNTHSQYVILIAFPLQQWLHERLSMFSLYVHCLSCSIPQRMRKIWLYYFSSYKFDFLLIWLIVLKFPLRYNKYQILNLLLYIFVATVLYSQQFNTKEWIHCILFRQDILYKMRGKNKFRYT